MCVLQTASLSVVHPTNRALQNSNVVAFFSMLKKDDRNEQMVYYQVRTSETHKVARAMTNTNFLTSQVLGLTPPHKWLRRSVKRSTSSWMTWLPGISNLMYKVCIMSVYGSVWEAANFQFISGGYEFLMQNCKYTTSPI